ncbi:hypothetical protein VT84_33280 [Gemmata sp. SH-PL17]|uniref:hypothetical protein n=1 Tax=Gemmata sp. SH-PL17 TaxID=1630693 RepID=UPI00078B1885|nr:hypothetical protein [Gemmata sp. SH-PL17]AMV29316.1 hypothetical protein VT84_33280 [Gemmata sp. SH-PL17]
MSVIPVSAQSLNALGDGYAGKAIDKCLDAINRDLIDRGHDGNARKLVVTYTFQPDTQGRLKILCKTKTTLPDYSPPETVAKYDQRAGGYVFNADNSENPDQMTLNDLDETNE